MKNRCLVIIGLLLIAGCGSNSGMQQEAFVTRLGTDTLVVEQFKQTEGGMHAKVILRTPETSFSSYDLALDESGGIRELVKRRYQPGEGFTGDGEIIQTIRQEGDSLIIETRDENGNETETAAYEAGVLPFIDMVHWPFELAFTRAAETDRDSINQKLLTGPRLSDFLIAKISEDSMTIRHPFRGVMGVDVDEDGRLQYLDAGLTTRKLTVDRVDEIDINAIGKRFVVMDQGGNSFGELSGAESRIFTFKGADFRVQYGSPAKRGREIFGGIVPWGERWRTGANRATHFSTSEDLVVGDLQVPAGEYTLFTIPEQDGGTLIINKQTGQNGQSYDEDRDLGRVSMQISTQPEVTGQFTIEVEESDAGGILKLIWDQTVFSVDFEIK